MIPSISKAGEYSEIIFISHHFIKIRNDIMFMLKHILISREDLCKACTDSIYKLFQIQY